MLRVRLIPVVLVLVALSTAAFVLWGATPASTPTSSATAKPATKKSAPSAKTSATAASQKAKVELGRKLVMVSACNDCHTPGTLFGAPDFDRELSGSELGWQGPWGTTYARNLTPDLETGLGYYKEQEIVDALKSGRRLDGEPMLPPMPWQNLAAYSDNELHAIAAFILSVKAVSHKVPDKLAPGTPPTGSFVVFPAPSSWDAPKSAPAGVDTTKK
jgi:mono/diheme cytochrome c family protein